MMGSAKGMAFFRELRRRRVFRVAGLYVVAAWAIIQAADILFPGWGIPDAAIRNIVWAAMAGFPVALVFGWIYQVTPEGIQRTPPDWAADELQQALPLRRSDYLILLAFVAVTGLIVHDTVGRVAQLGAVAQSRTSAVEIAPNSVAVLPFASLSADPEHEYFADGISEEILNRLSSFGELKVIARTSSFAFKGSDYEIGRISSVLGVQFLLQGSVRRDGQQLRISAQLVDRAGVQVWGQSFDRQLGAIFVLQDEIAEAVATSIVPRIALPPHEERQPDLEAYQEYLVGRQILVGRGPLFFQRSAERFTRAIELDPDFAEPYAGRAIGTVLGARWTTDHDAKWLQAQQDINMALRLNPRLAYAYAAHALLDQERNPAGHAAHEALLRRALELDPNLVDAMNWLAGALSGQGRDEEAFEVLRRAVRIDPLAAVINSNLARQKARRGQHEEAASMLLRLLETPLPALYPAITLAEIYELTGRLVESCGVAKRSVLSSLSQTGEPSGSFPVIRCYALLGVWGEVDRWNAYREEAWPDSYAIRMLGQMQQEGRRDPAETLAALAQVLEQEGLEAASLEPRWEIHLAIVQALAEDFPGAIPALEKWIDPAVTRQGLEEEINARHALAWALQQTGATERAAAMLQLLDEDFRRERAEGRLHLSVDIFEFARNTLLLGDKQRALDLLEEAVQAGWREYYAVQRDPRWDALRGEPRFEDALARVKADIALQRAQLAQIEAEDDFWARLEAIMAARGAEGGPSSDGTPPNR